MLPAKKSIKLSRDSVLAMGFNPYNTHQFLLLTKHEIFLGVSAVSMNLSQTIGTIKTKLNK